MEWHEEHFTCTVCKSPLAGKQFMEQGGNPYCERDFYEAFAPKCHFCQKPIMEQVVNALDKEWHPDCFKCSVWLKILTNLANKNLQPWKDTETKCNEDVCNCIYTTGYYRRRWRCPSSLVVDFHSVFFNVFTSYVIVHLTLISLNKCVPFV